MVRKILASLLIFLLMTSIGEAADLTNKTEVKNLRYSLTPGKVRIVVDMSRQVEYTETYLEYPSRLIVSFKNTWIDVKKMKKDIEINSSAASRIKVAQYDPTTVRVVIETVAATNLFWLSGGPSGQRFVIDLTDPNFVPEPEPETKKSETKKSETKKTDTKKTDDKEIDEPFTNKIENETPNTYKEDDRKPSKQEDKKSDNKDNKSDEKISSGDKNLSELDKDLENITGLKGKIICIDAGHGGGDSGAIGPTGVTEKSVTLRIALELEKLLKDEGAKVVMTRRTDKQVSSKGDKASAIEELQARCTVANQAKADIFISIHADSFTNPTARGTTGYYFAQSTGNKSYKLADAIRKALCEQLRTPSRGTKTCTFYVVRHTDMPATLIELAFISNVDEEKLLNSEEGVKKAAQGILDGIEDYFG